MRPRTAIVTIALTALFIGGLYPCLSYASISPAKTSSSQGPSPSPTKMTVGALPAWSVGRPLKPVKKLNTPSPTTTPTSVVLPPPSVPSPPPPPVTTTTTAPALAVSTETTAPVPSTPVASGDIGGWTHDAAMKVAICEEGGANIMGSKYSGYFGMLNSTWLAYGGAEFASNAYYASWDQQIIVAARIQKNPPDQNGCAAW